MEQLSNMLMNNYLNVTLACVIIGYLITTTPYLSRAKSAVPLIVTILGALLGVALHGLDIDVAIYGALAGILSTGLYELFGKGIKNLGKKLDKEGLLDDQENDPFDTP